MGKGGKGKGKGFGKGKGREEWPESWPYRGGRNRGAYGGTTVDAAMSMAQDVALGQQLLQLQQAQQAQWAAYYGQATVPGTQYPQAQLPQAQAPPLQQLHHALPVPQFPPIPPNHPPVIPGTGIPAMGQLPGFPPAQPLVKPPEHTEEKELYAALSKVAEKRKHGSMETQAKAVEAALHVFETTSRAPCPEEPRTSQEPALANHLKELQDQISELKKARAEQDARAITQAQFHKATRQSELESQVHDLKNYVKKLQERNNSLAARERSHRSPTFSPIASVHPSPVASAHNSREPSPDEIPDSREADSPTNTESPAPRSSRRSHGGAAPPRTRAVPAKKVLSRPDEPNQSKLPFASTGPLDPAGEKPTKFPPSMAKAEKDAFEKAISTLTGSEKNRNLIFAALGKLSPESEFLSMTHASATTDELCEWLIDYSKSLSVHDIQQYAKEAKVDLKGMARRSAMVANCINKAKVS